MRCQYRKIRCPRTFPCAPCIQVSLKLYIYIYPFYYIILTLLIQARAQCVQAVRAPTRPRQHELKRHLDRCEQLLQEVAGSRRGVSEPQRPSSSSSSLSHSSVPEPISITPLAQHSSSVQDVEDVLSRWTPFRRPDGKLVEYADGTVSFMEDGYLQSVHEEVSQAALYFRLSSPTALPTKHLATERIQQSSSDTAHTRYAQCAKSSTMTARFSGLR